MPVTQYYGKAEGGHPWSDNAYGQPLTSILIRSGDRVDGIQATYGDTKADFHGADAGKSTDRIDLEKGEYIVRVEGRYGGKLDFISFTTNFGKKFGPYGTPNGEFPFEVTFKTGVLSLNGRAGDTLDAIAFVY